jgi:hypothetical protein
VATISDAATPAAHQPVDCETAPAAPHEAEAGQGSVLPFRARLHLSRRGARRSHPAGAGFDTDTALEPADAGMSTVEYAVGTVVAAAFAAVLYRIVTGDSVVTGLTNLINSALSTTF